MPVAGPTVQPTQLMAAELEVQEEAQEERYKLCAYADYFKCEVTRMEELHVIVNGCVKLHRDVNSGRVKFLALSSWKSLTQ